MQKTKNQHYVPQFLLRNFSANENGIAKYSLPLEEFFENSSIKKECFGKNFYDTDNKIENFLGLIEQHSAPILKMIIDNCKLPDDFSLKKLVVYHFISSLDLRTKRSLKSSTEFIDSFTKQLFSKKGISNATFSIPNILGYQVAASYPLMTTILDLKMKLIYNQTSLDFIISDHPVIRSNYFLDRLKWDGGQLGYGAPGLVFILPISPKIAIILYDEEVYRIGTKKGRLIYINELSDIENINICQIKVSNENIYMHNKSPLFNEIIRNQIEIRANKSEINYIDGSNHEINFTKGIKFKFIHLKNKVKAKRKEDFSSIRIKRKNCRNDLFDKYGPNLKNTNTQSFHGDVMGILNDFGY